MILLPLILALVTVLLFSTMGGASTETVGFFSVSINEKERECQKPIFSLHGFYYVGHQTHVFLAVSSFCLT